jgi:hypothetical protein
MTTTKDRARALVRDLAPGPFQSIAGWACAIPAAERDAIVAVARGLLASPDAPAVSEVARSRDGFDVTTVEQLDALPVGSVVLNAAGVAFVRVRSDVPDFQWAASGHPGYWTASAILGEPAEPARVLYRPCCGDGPDGYCAACPVRPCSAPTPDDVAAAILGRYPSFDPITARALADVVAPLYEGTRP